MVFFQETGNCAEIFPVAITPFGTSCLQGFHGSVQMVDLIVEPNTSYYFAISANQPTGGDFALCVKTSSDDPHCLISGDIKVTDRSHTGSLEGPFFPGEKISVCMNVNEYSASSNSPSPFLS